MNNNSEIKTNMKPEEALKLLNDITVAEQSQGAAEYTDMLLVCKEVLSRNIKVRPEYWGDGYDGEGNLVYDQAKCPECGHDFEYNINDWGSPFCPDCGKALDWSEYEEYDKEPLTDTAQVAKQCWHTQNSEYIEKLEAENERLINIPPIDPMDFCGVVCNYAEELIEKAKSEAYKEFVTKAEEKATNLKNCTGTEVVFTVDDLYDLLKEMR